MGWLVAPKVLEVLPSLTWSVTLHGKVCFVRVITLRILRWALNGATGGLTEETERRLTVEEDGGGTEWQCGTEAWRGHGP